jgi:heme-degrading monooxygenase HmoA
MIARFWSAQTQLQGLDGFLGATVCTRSAPDAVEILVTTYWASLAAIDAFAGADREAAVVAAEAAALLTSFDKRVRHYEVAVADFSAIPGK